MELHQMFIRPEGVLGEAGADLMERHGSAMAAEAVERLNLKVDSEAIEIGFGPGLGIEALAKAVTKGHVTGVDPSTLMHRRAANRNAMAISQGRVTLVNGVVGALPFAPGSFDAALAIDNFHFWPDRVAGLQELKRVMRQGAKLVLAFTPPSGAMRAGIADLMTQTGWTDVALTECDAGFIVSGLRPG